MSAGKRIEEIDSNFKAASIGDTQLVFANALNAPFAPFALSGFPWRKSGERLCRLPEQTMAVASEGVRNLAWHTTGGMIRFRSDSPSIGIRAPMHTMYEIPRMPRLTSGGFDLYLGSGKEKRFFQPAPPVQGKMLVEDLPVKGLKAGEMREWTVYLPLYGGPESVDIGLEPGSRLETSMPFTIQKPLLFYGSSITQGACASRPGNCYANMLARWLDAPLVNLGFAGNAKGELAIAEAIAGLELSAFIYDYDHNAPGAEHLAATHEPFFRLIRERRPELPVVMASKCDYHPEEDARRREIVRTTWERAVERGDRRAFFVDGETLFGSKDRDACTVDGCHPNDLGFYRMAETIFPALQKALGCDSGV